MAATANPRASSGASAATPRQPESITSRDNRWLKRFRAALAGEPGPRSSRDAGAEIAGIEGLRLVETALHAARQPGGVEIVAVLTSDTGTRHLTRLAPAIPLPARLLCTSDRLFAQIAATETPQGIAALVRPRTVTFDDLVCGVPLILMMAGMQDPGNVGVLVRTAEGFGATGAATCAAGGIGTVNPFGPKVLRASAGSALRLPILRGASAPVFMAQLRVVGVRLYAACPPVSMEAGATSASPLQSVAPWEADWRGPVALVIGNEGAGLPAELVRSADQIVRIPQAAAGEHGEPMDSLNASVAGAVLLYEAARQRGLL